MQCRMFWKKNEFEKHTKALKGKNNLRTTGVKNCGNPEDSSLKKENVVKPDSKENWHEPMNKEM